MSSSTLTSKNQTTIPKAVVEALGVNPSDKIFYEIEESGRVILTARTATFASVAKLFSKKAKGRSRTVEEIKEAARKGAVKRVLRGLK